MKRFHLFSLVLLIAVQACKKDPEIVVIPDNTAPPDNTIPAVLIETYVNKVYVSLVGREPVASELEAGVLLLRDDNLSEASRKDFIQTVQGKDQYTINLYELARNELLNALDTGQITENIAIFEFLLTDSTNLAFFDFLHFEIGRLQKMKSIPADLSDSSLDVTKLHQRCVDNYFYDQINMGTENFVVSTFQQFLLRYPTQTELDQGKRIVDGFEAILFFKSGKTKTDYYSIFFGSDDYYEGQVRDLFSRHLFREPTPSEISYFTQIYKEELDYLVLQQSILSLDEYVGLEE